MIASSGPDVEFVMVSEARTIPAVSRVMVHDTLTGGELPDPHPASGMPRATSATMARKRGVALVARCSTASIAGLPQALMVYSRATLDYRMTTYGVV